MMDKVSVLRKDHNFFPVIKNTMISGFVLRLAVLIFMFTIGLSFSEPYFIIDDIKYENLAEYYMLNAKNVLDLDLFDRMTVGYMQQFWPFVECVSAKLFNNIYAGRILNILISTICIGVVYKLTFEVSNNGVTALKAAKLFAYLPVTVLTCCFPIKDIYITWGIMYAFYIFIRIQSGKKVRAWQLILCTALLVGVYLSRGAVVEMMLMFLFVYYMQKLIKEKRYAFMVFSIALAMVFLLFFNDIIFSAFETKVDDYSGYADAGEGINFIKVTGLSNIYKLPLAYAFATLQPLKLDLLEVGDSFWLTVMSYANITIYPIAVGNFIYVITKKHNLFFWLSTFTMYSAVIILSLGIFRHYLFLLPVQIINYSLFIERDPENNNVLSTVGAVGLFIIIFLASALNIF